MRLARRPLWAAFTAIFTALALVPSVLGPVRQPASAAEPVHASATLGTTPDFDGLTAWAGDGSREPRVREKAGRECWSTDKASDRLFVYVDIDDALLHDGEFYSTVTVDYFDEGGGTFTLVYDGADAFDVEYPEPVHVGSSGTWKQATFRVERAAFADRLNQADFRLAVWAPSFGHSSADVCFGRIDLTDSGRPTHDVRIAETTPGNVFVRGRTPRFTVHTIGDSLRWTVYDAYDRALTSGRAATPEGTADLATPVGRNGYFELAVAAYRDGELIRERRASFAVLPDEMDLDAVAESPFGMSAHLGRTGWNPQILARLARLAGVKNIRDEIEWRTVELERGVHTMPANGQRYMEELEKNAIDPFIIFSYTNALYDDNVTPHTPEAIDAFAAYGRFLVRYFDGEEEPALEQVEVYNEYNIPPFSSGPCATRADCYVRMLKRTYERVKAERPGTTVVGAATSGIPMDWLEEVFRLGGLEYMDAVSVHPYRYPRAPEGIDDEIAALEALIEEYNGGESKPIWITELGWPTHRGGSGVDENTQAAYLARAQIVALSAGVEKFFWYDLMNDGVDPDYNENNFGIIRNSADELGRYAPKPAYVSEAVLTRHLTGAEYRGRDEVPAGVHSHRFTRNGTDVRAIWADDSTSLALHGKRPLTVTDIWGNTTELRPVDGTVSLTATPTPVYVSGPVTGIDQGSTVDLRPSQDNAVVGEPVAMTLQVDARSAEKAIPAEFELEGRTYRVVARPGKIASREVELPPADAVGSRPYSSVVRIRGAETALLHTAVTTVPAAEVRVVPRLDRSGTQTIGIDVTNNSMLHGRTLDEVAWNLGDLSGTLTPGRTLEPGSTTTIDVAPDRALPLWTPLPVKVTARLGGLGPVEHEGVTGFDPVTRHTLEIDGDVGELADVPGIDLEEHGEVLIDDYGGPSDLSGQVWATWDEDNLYLAAKITDDVFSQDHTGGEMWQGDGVQFTVGPGLPGEATDWYEYGVALTSEGPEAFRWIAPPGVPIGSVDDATVEIRRDESSHTTTYELALPWSAVAPVVPDDGGFGMALVVNDNDGQGRAGWIEWGTGIARAKDPGGFRPMQLLPGSA